MRKRNLKTKFLASTLAVAMVASLLPTSVMAGAEEGNGEAAVFDVVDEGAETGGETGGRTDGGSGGRTDDGSGGRTDGGSGGGKGGGGTTYSDSVLTVPEALVDGTYAGTATVQADENEQFTNYTIRVSVTISDGKIANVALSGAGGSNLAYSNDALSGILRNVSGQGAGDLEVDTVSGATCSSKGIVKGMNAALQGEVSQTTFSVNDGSSSVTYLPEGSKFTVKITNPVEGVDYSKIGLAYGVGKFADDLSVGNDFFVEQLSKTDTDVTYQIKINPNASYFIEDDGIQHSELYNTPGMNLTLTVGDEGLGTIYIRSSAKAMIDHNMISLTGGNGETLADYLALVDEVTVRYTDEEGNAVSKTYTTQWQHDIDPAFLGTDIFRTENGSINFDVMAMVTRIGDDNEAEKDEEGNNIVYEESVFPSGADGNYFLRVTAGDGYDEVSAWVGKDYGKGTTTVTLADKNATYTGAAILIGPAKVTGSTGTVSYAYYTDSNCTKKTSVDADGASVAGGAPVNAGIYYVKASVAGDDNYMAATSGTAKLTIGKADSKIELMPKSATYTGKAIAVETAKVTGSSGKVTYTYYTNKECTKKTSKDANKASVNGGAPKDAGTYYVKASVAADANYSQATSSAVKLTIKKAAQNVKVKTASKSYKASKLKKAAKTFRVGIAAKGALKYSKKSGSSKLLFHKKSGKITVKKGTAKGTYKMKLQITAKATKNYKAKTVTKTVTVKVR